MPLRQRVAGACAALGFIMLLAGCGGAQNPVKADTAHTSPFFNGLWDGLTVLVVFFKNLIEDSHYRLYTHGASDAYFVGYIIGIVILAAIVGKILDAIFD